MAPMHVSWSVKMRVQIAGVVVLAAAVGGCGMFDGGKPAPESADAIPVGQLTSECARLQPLFAPGSKELSREDMEAALKREYAKWDKDGNGQLSHSEIEPLNDMLRAENTGASPVTDWNADGQVDMKEFGSGWRTMFDLCDRNGNNVISLRELGFSPNVAPPRPSAPAEPAKQPEGASQRPGGGY